MQGRLAVPLCLSGTPIPNCSADWSPCYHEYAFSVSENGDQLNAFRMTAITAEIILGFLTCTGSIMAAAKLLELKWIPQRPLTYPGQNFVNLSPPPSPAELKLAFGFLVLLAKTAKMDDHLLPGLIAVNFDVIPDAVRGEEPVGGPGGNQPPGHDLLQQCACVLPQFPGLVAEARIVEYRRIAAAQLPDVGKRGTSRCSRLSRRAGNHRARAPL